RTDSRYDFRELNPLPARMLRAVVESGVDAGVDLGFNSRKSYRESVRIPSASPHFSSPFLLCSPCRLVH
ncbi:MAG: hypothetical protein ACKOEZ_07005, partial [Spartobacteria bacterium]